MSALGHHWRAIREALAEEKARTATRRIPIEADFLPAALEVIERPVSPTGRLTAWVLLIGLILTMIWVSVGKIDIVASASGRIVPTGNVKLVQAATSGIVRAIYVRDGDMVRRGQALVDLDPTVSSAEEEQAVRALQAAQLDVARNQAIADAVAGRGMHFTPPPGTDPLVAETQRRLIEAQVASTRASVAGLAAATSSSLAEAQGAGQQIRKYDDTLPLIDRELSNLDQLDRYGLIPLQRLYEMRRQRRSELGERDIAVAQRSRAISDAAKFGQQRAEAREQALRQALADLAKAQSDAALRAEELTKARQKSRLQRLVSPVDGTVQQLAVHTVGGVVEAVKPIMIIVPRDSLVVEAKVLNKDAGFVRNGQDVVLKLEAFPFTRYGTVPGRIQSISSDAVDDRKLGAVYVARIRIAQPTIDADGQKVALAPGMTVTADVHIGTRSILSFLVSPLEQTAMEAGKEK